MRLAALDPSWLTIGEDPRPLGVQFQCPACLCRDGVVHYVTAWRATAPKECVPPGRFAFGSAASFQTLSILPPTIRGSCGWTGEVRHGEVRTR